MPAENASTSDYLTIVIPSAAVGARNLQFRGMSK